MCRAHTSRAAAASSHERARHPAIYHQPSSSHPLSHVATPPIPPQRSASVASLSWRDGHAVDSPSRASTRSASRAQSPRRAPPPTPGAVAHRSPTCQDAAAIASHQVLEVEAGLPSRQRTPQREISPKIAWGAAVKTLDQHDGAVARLVSDTFGEQVTVTHPRARSDH